MRERLWYYFFLTMFLSAFAGLGAWVVVTTRAHGADMQLPDLIRCGKAACNYREGMLDKFGQYSEAYLQRRWFKMCRGPARYDAMYEAHSLGRPNPCR